MLYSYDECIKKYGNPYQIEKMLIDEQIYKIERGIYSDKRVVSELDVIVFKYPKAVFTMDSAFYYHSLTDVIPEKFYLATDKDATKIPNTKVKQFFHRKKQFDVGIINMEHQNTTIQIYNKERMLIELIRNKNNMPFDYYKEIIESYRKIIDSMDIEKLQDYIEKFPKQDYIMKVIQLEVL